jgi:ATP-dependent Clp protease ATP-binding subunit ClpB
LLDESLDWDTKVEGVHQEVRRAFKPEFVNRLDDIVVFSTLTGEDLGQIVEITVDRLQTRLAERRLELAVTPTARLWLADKGFDPHYGARPLRRLMQKEIDDRLARALLAGEISDGDTVRVDLAEDSSGLTVAPFTLE